MHYTIKNAGIENAVHSNRALDSDVINVAVFLECKRPISWLRLKRTFIRFWHRNRRHSWPVGQWRSEGMLDRILKVEKKVRKGLVRIGKKNARPYTESRKKSEEKRCKNLTPAPMIVWKRKNPSPFRSSLECNHKMKMKYSEKGGALHLHTRSKFPFRVFGPS